MIDNRRISRRSHILYDVDLQIKDDLDPTKILQHQVAAIATGTTRTLTWPDQNLDMAPGSGDYAASGGAPAAHAASHTDGSDDIQSATNAQKGLATISQIIELETIAKSADGSILESIDFTVASDGAIITGTLQAEGGGDLDMNTSAGVVVFDCTPPKTIALTAGTDTVPQINYVYILTSSNTLTVATGGWPSAEFAPIATVLCQSAASLQTKFAYKVHVWSDHMRDMNNQGALQHIRSWIRAQHATWLSGVAPTFSGDGTGTIGLATTVGSVLQLHPHAFPVFADPATIYVVNDSGTAYREITNIADLVTDSLGVTLTNKTYALVFWGVVSEAGADCKIYCNLPSGAESGGGDRTALVRADANKVTDYSIPADFNGVGFLINRLVIKNNADTTWDVDVAGAGDDLRGLFPDTAAGTTSATSTIGPDLDLGLSGVAGSLEIFPSTAAKGSLLYRAADSAGDTVTEIKNASQAGARTYTLPDAGASASYVMTEGAASVNGVKTFGSIPLVPSKSWPVAATADGTDGEIPTWDASGVATVIGAGTIGQALISGGAGAVASMQTLTKYDDIGRIAVGRVDFFAEGTENCIVTVGAVTYTEEHVGTDATVGEWDNGGSNTASATNLAAGINGDTRNAGGPSYAAIASGSTVFIMALSVGTAGNVTVSADQAQPDAIENLIGGAAAAVKQTAMITHTITTEEADAVRVIIPLPFSAADFKWEIYAAGGEFLSSTITDRGTVVAVAGTIPAHFLLATNGATHFAATNVIKLVATN